MEIKTLNQAKVEIIKKTEIQIIKNLHQEEKILETLVVKILMWEIIVVKTHQKENHQERIQKEDRDNKTKRRFR